MQGKIALEEHFAIPDTIGDSAGFVGPETWKILERRLLDFQGERIEQMDQTGLERMLLSLNAPALQAIPDAAKALDIAKRANDTLAEHVNRRPDRFSGLAALPMHDPDAAAAELERCVRDFGFRGALVNGYTQLDANKDTCLYYDAKEYWPFWATVAKADVPFYLHPREPSQLRAYQGHPWLIGPAYGFAAETGLHTLRLIGSGLFDAYPSLTIILGHLGEGLPFNLSRIDQRIAWSPMGFPAKRKPSEYFAENFFITTAGNFRTQALHNCILEIGADRILYSTDYPFEQATEAAAWFDVCSISEADRLKIGRTNSLKLFKLGN